MGLALRRHRLGTFSSQAICDSNMVCVRAMRDTATLIIYSSDPPGTRLSERSPFGVYIGLSPSPAITWHKAFQVPPDLITSVVPTFFFDEVEDMSQSGLPRHDFAATLVEGAQIRYHFREPLYTSWHDVPDVVRRRKAAVYKIPPHLRFGVPSESE